MELRTFTWIFLFLCSSAVIVIGWPGASKYPDCTKEKITTAMYRICASSKRSLEYDGTGASGKGSYQEFNDDPRAHNMDFMKEVEIPQRETNDASTPHPEIETKALKRYRHSLSMQNRRRRQQFDIVYKACCSERGCPQKGVCFIQPD